MAAHIGDEERVPIGIDRLGAVEVAAHPVVRRVAHLHVDALVARQIEFQGHGLDSLGPVQVLDRRRVITKHFDSANHLAVVAVQRRDGNLHGDAAPVL